MFSNINRQQRYIYGRWVWVELFQVDGIWEAPSLPGPVYVCVSAYFRPYKHAGSCGSAVQ